MNEITEISVRMGIGVELGEEFAGYGKVESKRGKCRGACYHQDRTSESRYITVTSSMMTEASSPYSTGSP